MSDDLVKRLRGAYADFDDLNDAADSIEELEASKNEALNQLDSALYSVSVLEKRVRFFMDENADLKAKLAKAVKLGLEECPFWDGSGAYNDWWHDRRTTLMELTGDDEVKGGKDG